ncbi:phage tail protein [Lachnospiraceae bacterium 46-15]
MRLLHYNARFQRLVINRKDFKTEEKLDNGIAKKQISFSYPEEEGRIYCEDIIEYAGERYVVKEAPVKGTWGSVTAVQDTTELSGNPKITFSVIRKTVVQCVEEALVGSGWKYKRISADMSETRSISEDNTDSMKLLEKIADVFWVEISFSAMEKTIYLHDRIKTKNMPVRFIKGLNLKTLEIATDSYDFYTRIYPIGKDGMTIGNVNNKCDYLDNRKYCGTIRALIWQDTNYTDAEQLKVAAEKKLEELAMPKTTYTAQIIDMSNICEGYEEFEFGLGDEADIVDTELETSTTERIVRIIRYPDNPEKNTVELSNRNISFADMQKKLLAASDSISNVTNGNKVVISKIDGLQGTVQVAASEAVQTAVNSAAPNFLSSGRAPSADKWQTTRYLEGVGVDGTANRHHYTTCSTSGGTKAKTASLTGFSLLTGARVAVLFSNANTASNPTLNISSTGAKPIYYRNSAIPENYIQAGTVLELVYSGSYWRVIGDLAQHQVDGLKTENSTLKAEHDALEVRITPVVLYSSTLYASALNTWVYASIPSLKDWKEVRLWLEVGDADCRYNTLTREHTQICVSGYANANYNGMVRASCDFTNARIGLLVRSMAGWAFSNLRITRVEGLVKA